MNHDHPYRIANSEVDRAGENAHAMATRMCASIALGLFLTVAPGCFVGSLATNTGNTRGGEWSIDNQQYVHIGENVTFSFVLKKPLATSAINATGIADYCIFEYGDDADAVDVDLEGAFVCEHDFVDITPETPIKVTAKAYRMVGTRDRMKIAGQWLRNESPDDEPDIFVASDSVRLIPYQVQIVVNVPDAWRNYDFETAVLSLHRSEDEPPKDFRLKRGLRRGFTVDRSDPKAWRIRFEPRAAEVLPNGQMRAELCILDESGDMRSINGIVPTP